jgi:hypothetical protein
VTFEQMLAAYELIVDIAAGEYPMDSGWAATWLDSLDPALRTQLEAARGDRR